MRTKKAVMPKSEGMPVVVLTSDTLIDFVQRLNDLEAKVKSLSDEAQGNFDHLVEYVPTVIESGEAMQMKVFEINGDSPVIVEVACKKL